MSRSLIVIAAGVAVATTATVIALRILGPGTGAADTGSSPPHPERKRGRLVSVDRPPPAADGTAAADRSTKTRRALEPEPHSTHRGFPFARAIPGKPGFVFSPYNNKVVDVRGIPAGTLCADPTSEGEQERPYFRVPEDAVETNDTPQPAPPPAIPEPGRPPVPGA